MDLKSDLVKRILFEEISKQELLDLVAVPPDTSMGDFSIPCFSLAKKLRKSPAMIAEEINEE